VINLLGAYENKEVRQEKNNTAGRKIFSVLRMEKGKKV